MLTAATQAQKVDVTQGKKLEQDLVVVLRDTVYNDSIQYNDLTKVFYTIGRDTVGMNIQLYNTQYLYVYTNREYKNKKNFFQRLFTFDWKKVTKFKYKIVNSNDLIQTDSVRVVIAK